MKQNVKKYSQKEFELNVNKFLKEPFLKLGKREKLHRYFSWDILNEKFKDVLNSGDASKKEVLSLHISMYLASWGMYRGSTKLLKYFNFKINKSVVEILLKSKYKSLENIKSMNDYKDKISLIIELYDDIKINYNNEFNSISKNENVSNSPTDTLITKIILGTYACFPAYDTNVKASLREFNVSSNLELKKNREKPFLDLYEMYKDIEFDGEYPIMKQIDMSLFKYEKK
ncbi:MAG: hypothetical protein HRS50_02105 [Mycoplasmataceae bacterium]|nr:hypothetical protein [Mycoplasmataceae bacterium]